MVNTFLFRLMTSLMLINIPILGLTSSATGNSGAEIAQILQVVKYQDLNYGIIVPSTTLPGTARVRHFEANNISCSSALTCLSSGKYAVYRVTGEQGRYITISNPGSISISDDAGNTMLIDNFVGGGSGNDDDWAGGAVLSPGVNEFYAGGTLHVNPNQPPGQYVGTFTVSFEYQ